MSKVYKLQRQSLDPKDYQYAKLAKLEAPEVLPPFVDMRDKMPYVFDQGELGSCTANSTVAYVMYLLGVDVLLSRLDEYYRTREVEETISEDSGCSNRDAVMTPVKFGICEEKYFPYDITKFTQAPSPEANANAGLHKVSAVHAVNSLDEIKHCLAVHGSPVVLGMEVFESFESQAVAKTGKMPLPTKAERNLGGHSVLVVGYIDKNTKNLPEDIKKVIGRSTTKYLIVRNSWGKDWGLGGYFLMPQSYVANHTFDYWMIEK